MLKLQKQQICFIVDESLNLYSNRQDKKRVQLRMSTALEDIDQQNGERRIYIEVEDFRSGRRYQGEFTKWSVQNNINSLSVGNIQNILKLLMNFHYSQSRYRQPSILLEYETMWQQKGCIINVKKKNDGDGEKIVVQICAQTQQGIQLTYHKVSLPLKQKSELTLMEMLDFRQRVLRQRMYKIEEDHHATLAEHDQEIQKLNTSIKQLESSNRQLKDSVQQLKQQLNKKNQQCEILEKRIKASEWNISNMFQVQSKCQIDYTKPEPWKQDNRFSISEEKIIQLMDNREQDQMHLLVLDCQVPNDREFSYAVAIIEEGEQKWDILLGMSVIKDTMGLETNYSTGMNNYGNFLDGQKQYEFEGYKLPKIEAKKIVEVIKTKQGEVKYIIDKEEMLFPKSLKKPNFKDKIIKPSIQLSSSQSRILWLSTKIW